MQETDVKPWYKQFYPWMLICIPLSSFIVGGFVIKFATDGTNTLVVDDYYKEGKSINARLDKLAKAEELGIKTTLTASDGGFVVEFISGAPKTGEALKLDFYHVTQPEKDFTTLLTADANGVYRSSHEFTNSGKWRIRLTPMDEHWKLQRMVVLPQTNKIALEP
jgi:hypothetical protein